MEPLELLAFGKVEDPCGAIGRARRQPGTVGAERQGQNRTAVAGFLAGADLFGQLEQCRTAGGLPEPHRPVPLNGSESASVRSEGDALVDVIAARVRRDAQAFLAAARIPDLRHAALVDAGQGTAVR